MCRTIQESSNRFLNRLMAQTMSYFFALRPDVVQYQSKSFHLNAESVRLTLEWK